jgi:tetratricopeptide (TPR) repeat protein
MTAGASLASLVAEDPLANLRQVAMVDKMGEVAVHTGSACVGHAGHKAEPQVSAQANMMERDTVWGAMIDSYLGAVGENLASRLLLALEAGEQEGGDVRGMQSAALLVVDAEGGDQPWNHRLVDLRVDDSDEPLIELRRLLDISRGADRMDAVLNGDLLLAPSLEPDNSELAKALEALDVAQRALGANREPSIWSAVLLAKAGRIEEARDCLRMATETNDRWPMFVESLMSAGVLPPDSPLLAGP